jgi:protein gp37
MSEHGTEIGWTHVPGYKGETWNPVTGCDRVSPGCAHCYALELAERLKGMGQPRYQRDGDPKTSGPGFGLTLHPDKLQEPLRWSKPRGVFVNSMSDVFHEEIPDDFVIEMFNVMAKAPRHIFMVLTKRPERMQAMVEKTYETLGWSEREPLPNVWMGVTIENRRFVDRADLLRQTPAAVRFVSAEPLLGPLVFDGGWEDGSSFEPTEWADDYAGPELDPTAIDWIITGGESGGHHRRFDPQWASDICRVAHDNGTAFFHKQNGGRTPKAGGRELDGKTWDEFPPHGSLVVDATG